MLKYDQKYLCWDCETEGLNLHSSRPWQLAWIVCEGNRIIEKHDRYIDFKNLDVPEVVQKLTGFNWSEYLAKKENPKNVWSDFKKYLFDPQYKIVGQNLLGFDVYMIAELQRILGEKPDYSYLTRVYDTVALGRAYREELQKPKGDFLSWQYKVIHDRSLKAKASQNQLLKYFGIDFDESKLHNAMYDIEMCFKVFLELKKNMGL
jgi:DNA polymerase III alpha subunit (gram-positive type)